MSTSIEWTQRPGTKGETWNPTTGCNKVSAGCKNCYAEVMHRRQLHMNPKKYDRAFNAGVVTHPDTLAIPLKWKKPRTVFVNSMSDLFHADVPFDFIDQVFAIMALTPQHTYQILTKRPERMAEYCNTMRKSGFGPLPSSEWVLARANDLYSQHIKPLESDLFLNTEELGGWPLKNVWLGTSVENQAAADERIPHLLRVPAAVRFLSCEPLLGSLTLDPAWLGEAVRSSGGQHSVSPPLPERTAADPRAGSGIGWVITGGESGQHARPMHPDWARSLRDQCAAAGVPFFFKQWGEFAYLTDTEGRQHAPFGGQMGRRVGKHASGNLLDGRTHLEYPGGIARQASSQAPRHPDPAQASSWNSPSTLPHEGQRIDVRCRKDANYAGWYFGTHHFHGMPNEEPAVFSVAATTSKSFTVFPWTYAIEWRPHHSEPHPSASSAHASPTTDNRQPTTAP